MVIKQIKSTLTLLFTMALVFCGCGKTGSYEMIIENRSGYDILAITYSNYKSIPDSFQIGKGSQQLIGELITEDVPKTCESLKDSVRCVIDSQNNLKIKIDLGKSDNYTYSRTGSFSKGYHVVCRATITDADIVPK